MRRLDVTLRNWDGVVPGLATVRLLLVLAVVAFGSAEVSDSWLAVMRTPLWIVQVTALPALFVLAGFLLSMARRRTSRVAFLVTRARRTLPAVVVLVLVSVLGLGPALTTRPAGSYFGDPTTWSYLANLAAFPVYALPGVFEFNNVAGVVNAMVGVFPIYALLVATVAAAPAAGRRGVGVVALVAALIVVCAVGARLLERFPTDPRNVVRVVFSGPGLGMLLGGWLGVLADRLRTRVGTDNRVTIAAAVVLAAVALRGNAGWADSPLFWVVVTPVLAYATLTAAFSSSMRVQSAARVQPLLLPILLFAYPLQQAIIDRGPRAQGAILNFTLAIVPLAGLALAYRWLVGKRVDGGSAMQPVVLAASAPQQGRMRARRPVRARVTDLAGPIVLIVAVGALMVLVMGMLYLALSR